MSKRTRVTGRPSSDTTESDETVKRGPFDEPTIEDFLANNHSDVEIITKEGWPPLAFLKKHFQTKSAVIRYLTLIRGFADKDVAKYLGIRQQMVRNVRTKYIKRGANEAWTLPEGVVDPSLGAERAAAALDSSA